MIHFLSYCMYIVLRGSKTLYTGLNCQTNEKLEKFELIFSRCAPHGKATTCFVLYFMMSAMTSNHFQTEMPINLAWFYQLPWSVSP